MKLFKFFKKNVPAEAGIEQQQRYLVDDLYYITTSSELKPVKSDRFRMETESGKVQLSISNYEFSHFVPGVSVNDITNFVLPLFKDFIENGGYIPLDNLTIEDNFVCQSFKVGQESQYILYTLNNFNNRTIVSSFMLSDFDTYKEGVKKILLYTYYKMEPK